MSGKKEDESDLMFGVIVFRRRNLRRVWQEGEESDSYILSFNSKSLDPERKREIEIENKRRLSKRITLLARVRPSWNDRIVRLQLNLPSGKRQMKRNGRKRKPLFWGGRKKAVFQRKALIYFAVFRRQMLKLADWSCISVPIWDQNSAFFAL